MGNVGGKMPRPALFVASPPVRFLNPHSYSDYGINRTAPTLVRFLAGPRPRAWIRCAVSSCRIEPQNGGGFGLVLFCLPPANSLWPLRPPLVYALRDETL